MATSPSPTTLAVSPTSLPIELLSNVFSYLDRGSLAKLCLINSLLCHYARDRLYSGALFILPCFAGSSEDVRRYTKLLRVLGNRPALGRRVRNFVVPAIPPPHERLDDMLFKALINCPLITAFTWRSVLSVPVPILRHLHALGAESDRLRSLTMTASSLEDSTLLTGIAPPSGLEEVILGSPNEALQEPLVEWINSMSASVQRLHIENAPWLTDRVLERIRLPNLKQLSLHECSELTGVGVGRVLRQAAPSLRVLYLNLERLRLHDVLAAKDNHVRPLELPQLRSVSLRYEPDSLSFWINAQALFAGSPIETFHVLHKKTSSSAEPSPAAGPAAADAPAATPGLLAVPEATPPTPSILTSPTWVAHRILSFARGGPSTPITASTSPASFSSLSNASSAVGEDAPQIVPNYFISRFAELHGATLRKFWVDGLRVIPDRVPPAPRRQKRTSRPEQPPPMTLAELRASRRHSTGFFSTSSSLPRSSLAFCRASSSNAYEPDASALDTASESGSDDGSPQQDAAEASTSISSRVVSGQRPKLSLDTDATVLAQFDQCSTLERVRADNIDVRPVYNSSPINIRPPIGLGTSTPSPTSCPSAQQTLASRYLYRGSRLAPPSPLVSELSTPGAGPSSNANSAALSAVQEEGAPSPGPPSLTINTTNLAPMTVSEMLQTMSPSQLIESAHSAVTSKYDIMRRAWWGKWQKARGVAATAMGAEDEETLMRRRQLEEEALKDEDDPFTRMVMGRGAPFAMPSPIPGSSRGSRRR